MKKIIFLFFLTSNFYAFSQKKNNGFKQPFPVIEECQNSVIKEECFNTTISHKIIEALKIDVQNYLEKKETRKSVNVYINFIIGQEGEVIEETIKVTKVKSNDSIAIKLKNVALNLSKISPRKNEFNHPILTYYNLSVKLGWNKEKDEIIILEKTNDKKDYSESSNMTAPIYPGCSSKSNKGLKQCFSNKVTKLIQKKYKINKAIKGFNKKGSFYTYVLFKVDKNGEVNSYKVFGPNENIENEARRSLKKLKDLKPGTKNGKPVNVNFAIPLKFKL